MLERVKHLRLGDRADDLALAEDHALAVAGGQPHIRITRLARSVHHAAHHRDPDRLVHCSEEIVDLIRKFEEVHLDPTAGRAGDHGRSLLPQLQRLQNLVPDEDLFDGISSEGDSNRVPDPHRQQGADPDGRANTSGARRASLRNTEVERIVVGEPGEATVGFEQHGDLERLQADFDVAEVQVLQYLDVAERRADKPLGP